MARPAGTAGYALAPASGGAGPGAGGEDSAPAAPAARGRALRWAAAAAAACLAGAAVAGLAAGGHGLRTAGGPRGRTEESLQGNLVRILQTRASADGGFPAIQLDLAVGKKGSKTKCPGFQECPTERPAPYSDGVYPTAFDYSGAFPAGFVWGMGTASYQVEGAYREDGRGASIWDTFSGADTVGMPGNDCAYCCKEAPCAINPAMYDKGATGNVAADQYHLYRTDVALMKSMGLKHYRFSISWPRLVPTGRVQDGVNPKAKEFYNSLIDELLGAGITPYITLYHWDLPQGLLDPPRKQGWWSRDDKGRPDGQILEDWKDYVRICFGEFGDRVKTWVTFNEAWTFTYLASGWGKAPSIEAYSNMTIDPYIAGHNVLNAHAAAVDIYRREFQVSQQGKIGITNNVDWKEPLTDKPEDIAAAERKVLFQLGWFSEPIYGKYGDYPPEMRQLFGSRLPEFTAEQKVLLNGSADFFGLNHYGTGWASYDPETPGVDMSYAAVSEVGFPRAMSTWLYGSGWGFRQLLNWIARRYDNPPIYVTEGGWSLPAETAEQGAADQQRLMYYANYTSEMRKAIQEDGVDIRGYFAWSLVDNFEWERGYKERFGLVYTEYEFGLDPGAPVNNASQPTAGRQMRRRKESSCWLESVWRSNALSDPTRPGFKGCVDSSVYEGRFEDPATECAIRLRTKGSGRVEATMFVPRRSAKGELAKKCGGVEDEEVSVPATFSGGTIMANFSAVGGPEFLAGFWDQASASVEWGDGAVWKKTRESTVLFSQ